MSKPAIIQIYANQPSTCADFYYRVSLPSRTLAAGYRICWTDIINLHERRDTLAREADLLIVNFVCDPEIIPLIDYRAKRKLPTVLEINDNFPAFQETNPMFPFYSNPENQALMFQIIAMCDMVQLTSPLMIDKFCLDPSKCAVFPNGIEAPPPYFEKNAGSANIGWGGSSGHSEDVKQIAPVLIALAKGYPQVNILIKSDPEIRKFFAAIDGTAQFYHEEYGSLEDYAAFLRRLHIGICTVREDEFNRTRTDVKFLEYAANSVVPVARNFGPYSLLDDTVCLKYTTMTELEECLIRLIEEPAARAASARRSYDYAVRERREFKTAERRAKWYGDLLGVTLEIGRGEYALFDHSPAAPMLYDFLDGKASPPDVDWHHHLYYYSRYYDSLEKIKFAIDTIKPDSVLLWKRYVELLIAGGKRKEAGEALANLLHTFPENAEFVKLRMLLARLSNDNPVMSQMLDRIKGLQPRLFAANGLSS